MAWPTLPKSVEELPHLEEGVESLRTVDSATASALCQLVISHGETLEALTAGDVDKERKLGSLLITASIMSANVRERALSGMPTP